MKAVRAGQYGAYFLVFAAVCAAFAKTVGYPFVLWDDPQYIQNNPLVNPQIPWPPDGFLTAELGYPIPVTVGLYRLVATLAGLQPWAFHALNVLLHALNTTLLFALLCRLGTRRMALFGALLWALHPLVVEPVTWCTGTKDLLYCCGFLLTIHAGLHRDRLPPWVLLVGLLTMLAKPTAIVLPAVLLWTVLATEGLAGLKRPGLRLAVLLLGVLALGIFAVGLFLAQHAPVDGYGTVDDSAGSLLERVAGVLQALDLQMRHALWPAGLLPQYFRLTDLRPTDPPFWRGLLWLLALILLAIAVFRAQDRRLRLWLGLALIAYVPVSMLLPIKRFTCDSYAYVPLLCLVALAVSALENAVNSWQLRGELALVCSQLLGLTLQQQPLWETSVRLWAVTVQVEPSQPLLIKRYAESLDALGLRDDAFTYLQRNMGYLKRGLGVDGMVLAMFADRAPPEQARALYAWTYAHERNLLPDAHRNFCTFVVKQQLQLTQTERQNLAQALDVLRRYHARRGEVQALLALAGLGGQQQLWPETAALLEHAWRLAGQQEHAEAAMVAYRNAGLLAEADRLQRALSTVPPVR